MMIGAHFDDIEINCGGTIAKATKNGTEVLMVVMGNGEFGHHSGKIIRTKKIAAAEGRQAAKILGVKINNLLCLGFKEKDIPYNSSSVEKLDKILSLWKPDLIITHWINDTHQDHINTAKAVLSAARYQHSILMWEPIFPSGRTAIFSFNPQIYNDISDSHEQKIKAILCHRSQVKKFKKSGVKWVEGITARSRYRGFEINCEHAETFQPVRLKVDL